MSWVVWQHTTCASVAALEFFFFSPIAASESDVSYPCYKIIELSKMLFLSSQLADGWELWQFIHVPLSTGAS